MLLGLTALAMFPIGWLGASLVILGLAFFVMEATFATHGILVTGGTIALLLGALLLIDTNEPVLVNSLLSMSARSDNSVRA